MRIQVLRFRRLQNFFYSVIFIRTTSIHNQKRITRNEMSQNTILPAKFYVQFQGFSRIFYCLV